MRTTLKLSEIVQQWMADSDISELSRQSYRRKVEMWFRWLHTSGVDPRNAERRDVIDYKKSLMASGKTALTVDGYVSAVKLFYKYCETKDYCNNIALGIVTTNRLKAHRLKALSSAQASRLLQSINTTTDVGKRDKLIVALMLFNGMRTCEVERMDVFDVQRDGDLWIIAIQRKGRKDKSEVMSISPTIHDLFMDYVNTRGVEDNEPLFVSHSYNCRGERLSRKFISTLIKRRLRSVGLNKREFTAHSLRHTCGCLMVERGVDIETIRDMLGHSSTNTTRIYVEMAQQRKLLTNSPSLLVEDYVLKQN